MKIEFDKALLWLLPYLYIISVTYYWGYWGILNFDAFNYYAVTDLVKGVILSISIPMLVIVIITIEFLIISLISDFVYGLLRFNLFIRTAIFAIIISIVNYFILPSVLNYLSKLFISIAPDDPDKNLSNSSLFILIALFLIAFIITIVRSSVSESKIKLSSQWWIFSLMLMPGSAFLEGRDKALIIKQNKRFDYVIKDSLDIHKKTIYKYLGKTGEYYTLMTYDNTKLIVVPTSKLNPLVIESFSILDSASMRRFKMHQKELALSLPQKVLLKKPITTLLPK